MIKVQVFDPALCCSSGVCGVDVDQALVTFAADVDWLKSRGVTVERFNLAQQPQAFAAHSAVRKLLETRGEAALPVILVDGAVMQRGSYPSRDELAKWTAGVEQAPSIFSEQVLEAASLQADLRRAGIEPWAWIVNGSLAVAETRSPLLRQRAAEEVAQIQAVATRYASRYAVIPLLAEEPVGIARLTKLVHPASERHGAADLVPPSIETETHVRTM